MKKLTYAVPALEKGLDILEILSEARIPLSLGEIAERLQKNRNEIFRMVNLLESRKYISKLPHSEHYTLTLKLYSLSHAHSIVEKLLEAARLPMQHLTDEIGESAHLAILQENEILVIFQSSSKDKVRISIEPGSRFPGYRTCSGRLLFATLQEKDRLDLLPKFFPKEFPPEEKNQFLDRLPLIQKQGYEEAMNETIVGLRDIAMLLGSPEKGLHASLAISFFNFSKTEKNKNFFLKSLKKTSEEIEKSLGLG